MKYPDPKNPKERVLEFHNKRARFPLPFYLVCDFESFLTTLDHNEEDVDAETTTNLIDEHNVCGFLVSELANIPNTRPTPSFTVDHK